MKRDSAVRALGALALLLAAAAAASLATAAFPGENGLIVFDTQDGGASQIYTIRPNGSDLRQLTDESSGGTAITPHWSADGRLIVYAGDQTGNREIYVMNADGSGKRQLTNNSEFDNSWPSLSPDGSTIVFSRCSRFLGTCDVAAMRSDGSRIRPLVGGYWHHGQTVFSPDGRQIAFSSDRTGYDLLLWTLNRDGTDLQLVTRPKERFFFQSDLPDWSPDGTRLTFTGARGEIFTIRPDGNNLRAITPPDSGFIFASYSPDGRKMVVRGPDGLSTMNADGSGLVVIPGVPLEATVSDWGVEP